MSDLIAASGGFYSKLKEPTECAHCGSKAEWRSEAVNLPVCSPQCANALWDKQVQSRSS